MPAIYWLIAAALLLLVEIITVDLTFAMLGVGALLASLTAWTLGLDWFYTQIAVFAVSSFLLLIFVRPWIKHHLARSTPDFSSNAQALLGRRVNVTQPVDSQSGLVLLNGQEWSARTEYPEQLPVGSWAEVVRIDGATAWVMPK
ncbi:NfeD family protein [Actinomycetaceae bacterium TAE3-ERU4]|nr:NfeD family protein [Actinomycetaceae bacterium TAE3-ERU4]